SHGASSITGLILGRLGSGVIRIGSDILIARAIGRSIWALPTGTPYSQTGLRSCGDYFGWIGWWIRRNTGESSRWKMPCVSSTVGFELIFDLILEVSGSLRFRHAL